MLTRAYDTIMASLQVPMIIYENVDFNSTAIDDSILNCKDATGAVRTIAAPGQKTSTGWSTGSGGGNDIPFVMWGVSTNTNMVPDESGEEPTYEDYSVETSTPSGWTEADAKVAFEKSYDASTKEIVCKVSVNWQNTSGASKTVYGVAVRKPYAYRGAYSVVAASGGTFLICREHFPSPVVVEDQGIIRLTFTWRVGRAGLVSDTSADGKVISFSVYSDSRDKTTTYQADDGMTWAEWVDSDYNTDGFGVEGELIYDDNHDVVCYEYDGGSMRTVSATREIVAGMRYEAGSDGS